MDSVLYRLWLKSKEVFSKKQEQGEAKGHWETLADVFVREAAVEAPGIWESESVLAGIGAAYGESLRMLWEKASCGSRPWAPKLPLSPESMLPQLAEKPPELEILLLQIDEMARLILTGEAMEGQESFGSASLCIAVSEDAMRVWLFAFPPGNGTGEPLSEEQVDAALLSEGVVYGVDEGLKKRLVSDRLYFKILLIACGVPPMSGEDGRMIECIPRRAEVVVNEREDGSVDYKSSAYMRVISKGDVICRMEPPTEGQPGIDVRGARVPAMPGAPVAFPKIKNAALSDDGLELRSAIDGNVRFENNQFLVESMLVIDGNVDGTVGNIDYDGDVLIEGDVREGFRVKATGNVVVKGMVECAEIVAGGNIVAEKGMNGNMSGMLEAKGDIRVKFLENCIAKSVGDIHAGSIIWSEIFCRGSLYVVSGRGVIIGGNLVVLKNIEAENIGNSSRRPLEITLGTPPELLARREELEQKVTALQEELSGLAKDLQFLENKSEEVRRIKQYGRLRLQKPLLQMQEQRLTRELATVYEVIADAKPGTIRCATLYPPVRLHFGAAVYNVTEIQHNCNIFEAHGQITVGTRN